MIMSDKKSIFWLFFIQEDYECIIKRTRTFRLLQNENNTFIPK